jgi:8-oxo-dGTP pyrophosphatase MutT (NUDIX family)
MTTDSFKIKAWRKSVEHAGCTISEVTTLQQLSKRDGSPLFSLLDVAVTSPEGRPLPNFVFIRGNATVVVPLLVNTSTGEERFLMVRQHRIGNGMLTLEFPAGMLDHENDDPASIARKELLEETGLSIPHSKLVPLWSSPLFSSAGASDEAIYYFGCRIELKNDRFVSFQNRVRENAGEREFITVTLLTYEEALPQINSIQALLGFSLFHNKFVTS